MCPHAGGRCYSNLPHIVGCCRCYRYCSFICVGVVAVVVGAAAVVDVVFAVATVVALIVAVVGVAAVVVTVVVFTLNTLVISAPDSFLSRVVLFSSFHPPFFFFSGLWPRKPDIKLQ